MRAAGADPSSTTIGGSTALHYAAESASRSRSALLEFKADPTHGNVSGDNANDVCGQRHLPLTINAL